MAAMSTVSAQDCRAILLPYFNNDEARLNQYPADKQEVRCLYSTLQFDVADEVPIEAVELPITAVVDRFSDASLPSDFIVDLTTLSYYRYNFNHFQGVYPDQEIYFSTPASAHPYLVLHKLSDVVARHQAITIDKLR